MKLATGHPPGFHYVAKFKDYFAPQFISRVEARTEHKAKVLELYSGSAVKVAETLEGLESGIVDVGGFCYCFEPAKLPLHGFQVWMPFGPASPIKSVAMARDVYGETPELLNVFPEKFNQKMIGLIVLDPYELISKKPITKLDDLKGYKVGAAGANLAWFEPTGAVGIQSNGATAYTSFQQGVYDSVVLFASFALNGKLYDSGKHYTKLGIGAVTWLAVHVNKKWYEGLPPEVQEIVLELGRDYEQVIAMEKEEDYLPTLAAMEKLGVTMHDLSAEEKAKWADALKGLPQSKATELDGKGFPGTLVAKRALAAAERHGHTWPVRYDIK
ncbi:MAG: C4-dicarboxylate TRAP transporter substrate-binding protein [Verrucomicrobiia bacterium]